MKMRIVTYWTCWLGLVVVLAPAGCMMGPDYQRPETVADHAGRFVHGPEQPVEVNDVERLDEWWKRFGDPVTADLVLLALKQNHDLKVAAARVLQAQASLAQAHGQLLPDISYNMLRDRSKRFINFGGGGFGGISDPNAGLPFDFSGLKFSPLTTTWSHNISVTYLLDLFGKLRRAQRAAWADMLAVEAAQQAVVNSVIASVIQARVNIATLERRLDITRADIASWERTLEITERRYREGLVGPVDVRFVRANLEAVRAQEPSVQLSLATTVHALDVLLGRAPGAAQPLAETLPELPELEPVPVGMPAALLDRRPDVRSAEFQLLAANERVGVSIAQLYPDLVLTGSYGFSGTTWEEIWDFGTESEVYSAIMNVAAPLWQGGRLRAQIKAAKARYEELAASYAGVVLNALREVEDALVSEQLLQRQLEHLELQVRESRAAEELARQRYEQGVQGILAVLESERQRRVAEQQLTILKGQIWVARVNLHLALGGDWHDGEVSEEHVAKK